jgi:hypothetical protein
MRIRSPPALTRARRRGFREAILAPARPDFDPAISRRCAGLPLSRDQGPTHAAESGNNTSAVLVQVRFQVIVAPDSIDLASPPAGFTVSGANFADLGFGLPVVNFARGATCSVLPLEQARRAHEMLAGAPHDPGKIMLEIR